MINLKTGKHFNSTATPLTEVTPRGTSLTRGGFLKGILASGIAPSLTIGAVSLAGSANATVRRGLGARLAANFAGGGGGGVSAKSYVQDGLVAMWDGIENVGWGVHDDNTTTWIDLIGGIAIEMNTITFSENSAVFDGTSCVRKAFSAFNIPVSNGIFSVDSCVKLNSSGTSWFLCSDSSHKGIAAPMQRDLSIGWVNKFGDTSIGLTYDEIATVSLVDSSSYLRGYKNSVQRFSRTQVKGTSNGISFGANYGTSYATGRVYSFRFYNVALTDDILAYNYAVDAARFGIT